MAITDCMYADDLLVFGKATTMEATQVLHTLTKFSQVSGQVVGPSKSSIWFSKCTPQEARQHISTIFSIPNSTEGGKYLGAPIMAGRNAYDFIIEKFSSRLQAWKARILSQSGRIVLIKSVLQSLPVYHMGTVKLPTRVSKALTGLIRRFYWGAVSKKHYLAHVAWDQITKPLSQGGLAIRDIDTVNEAMLMKALWKIAQKGEAQWVHSLG